MAKKRTPPKKTVATAAGGLPLPPARQPADDSQPEFEVVLQLINEARSRTVSYANTTLIDLYWSIGEFISGRISTAAWGEGTVQALAEHIRRHRPNVRGFSAQNLWRMRQFYETYRDRPELSALLRELSWTNNMLILGKSNWLWQPWCGYVGCVWSHTGSIEGTEYGGIPLYVQPSAGSRR